MSKSIFSGKEEIIRMNGNLVRVILPPKKLISLKKGEEEIRKIVLKR